MIRKPRNFRPQATELEAKLLLTKVIRTPEVHAGVRAVSVLPSGSTPATAVSGVARGNYFSAASPFVVADAPTQVQFHGRGQVDGLGQASLAGDLDLGGYRVRGAPQVTGTLTLSNARGSVKLDLTGGDRVTNIANGHFVTTARVVEGTGAYRGFRREGTVTLDFGADRVLSQDPLTIGGAAKVTLRLKPPGR